MTKLQSSVTHELQLFLTDFDRIKADFLTKSKIPLANRPAPPAMDVINAKIDTFFRQSKMFRPIEILGENSVSESRIYNLDLSVYKQVYLSYIEKQIKNLPGDKEVACRELKAFFMKTVAENQLKLSSIRGRDLKSDDRRKAVYEQFVNFQQALNAYGVKVFAEARGN